MIRPALLAAALFLPACSQTVSGPVPTDDFFSLQAATLEGEPVSFEDYRGKAVLVVNVASKCGFTGQYEGLQTMSEQYADQGLVVLGFPCNQFLGQEPGSAEDIRAFCTDNFQVDFPMMEKVEVLEGEAQSPVYAWLGGKARELPSWNFGKYLVSPDGSTVQYFGSRVAPEDEALVSAVEAAIPQG